MTRDRDFKREHFDDKSTGKFQQNTYDKFRKQGSKMSSIEDSITALENTPSVSTLKNSKSLGAGNGTATSFTKTGNAAVINFSAAYMQSLGGGWIRLLKNGSVVHTFSLNPSATPCNGPSFVWHDSVREEATVTYTLQHDTTFIAFFGGIMVIHEV